MIKEVVLYLSKVLNEKTILRYQNEIKKIIESEYCKLPYVNIWIAHLLQKDVFQNVNLPENLDAIIQIRDKALIAKSKNNTTFIKDNKENIDVLSPWDKRAVLFSSIILSKDETINWLSLINGKDNILDRSIAKYVISIKKTNS